MPVYKVNYEFLSIAENKARLQLFQEKLEYQVDDGAALKHLQEEYRKFLSGVIIEEAVEETGNAEAALGDVAESKR